MPPSGPIAGASSGAIASAFRVQSSAAELRQGVGSASESFSDFSTFAAGGEGQVGLGRARSSIDAGHAARQVADHLIDA